MQDAIKSGGLIDGISSLLNFAIDKVEDAGVLNNKITESIRNKLKKLI